MTRLGTATLSGRWHESRTPGICRIDQPEKHNHGFFVRVQRRGKIHSAFFADQKHGRRSVAFAAAQEHYPKLLRRLGLPKRKARRRCAEIRRRKGYSSIVGVLRMVVWRDGRVRGKYWKAIWSPERYVVARKVFSVQKVWVPKSQQVGHSRPPNGRPETVTNHHQNLTPAASFTSAKERGSVAY